MTLLTEEGKRLRSAALENARLREEVEMLRERCEAYKGQVWAGSQEIERLRVALNEIVEIDHYPDATIARKALGIFNEQDAPAKDRG